MMSHFNDWRRSDKYPRHTPCGKELRRCNWADYREGVTCKVCLKKLAEAK